MKGTRLSDNKKRIGRPPTGVGTLVGQRCREDQLDQIDRWRREQLGLPSRAEAIRLLVEIALKGETQSKPLAKPGRRTRAQELAREVIEKMIDPAATPDERAQRRRRLTKGPPEFREDRLDLPKAKVK